MTQKLTIRLAALLVAACLVLTATPALAAPARDASVQEAPLATRVLDALHAHLQDLWSHLAPPVEHLFGAQGNKPDPTGDDDPALETQAGKRVDPNG